MLTPALIVNIRTLLARVPLKGEEVPAFNEIIAALAAHEAQLLAPPSLPSPPPE